MNLILTWSENCVIISKVTRYDDPDADLAVAAINNPTNAIFKIADRKLYVPVVTLATEDDNKFLEQLKIGFKRSIKWNKYRSEVTKQAKTNSLNYQTDPIFNKVNRLFVLSFENEEDRTSYSKYYTSSVEIKHFSVLIDGKNFYDMPIKNKEETYKKVIEMSEKNDYTTDNLLNYDYFSNHYKLIAIDLSKQIELENNKLILLVNLKKMMEQQCFSSLKNQRKQLLNFHKIL